MSTAARPSLLAYSAVVAAALSLAACSGETPAGDGDAGDEVVACTSQSECADGQLCLNGLCKENVCDDLNPCPSGYACDVLTAKCKVSTTTTPDGGTVSDGGGTTTTDGGTTSTACSTKYDCENGQICKQRKCANPSATDSCSNDNECPRGRICNFSHKCEAGCVPTASNSGASKDCDSPLLCHPQKFVCEACSLSNPCDSGKSCVSGECRAAVTCNGPSAADCVAKGLDGTVCANGICTNCAGHADCAVDPYKNDVRICATDGLCKKSACTDADCQQQLGARGYCDTASNQCASRQCLSNTDCVQPQVCNPSTYTCQDPAADCVDAALTDCQTQCAANGSQCNVATCSCGGTTGGSGTGVEGDACAVGSDCATGFACGLGVCMEAVADPACVIDLGFLKLCSGCVGAATGRACDDTSCILMGLMGGLFGGGGGSGSGASCTSDADCDTTVGETCSADPLTGAGTCQGGQSGGDATPCY